MFGTISGEIAALQMIADNKMDPNGVRFVWGALYAGFAGVIVGALSQPGSSADASDR
ncbi:MAG: hypothetical protein QOH30_2404 [Baekduia sp.]|jgi:hypothetical protein|nr:hypothetical protein [Conexibacter sp.]MDX6715846.1 hypothetical protein [Baekduia sp.]